MNRVVIVTGSSQGLGAATAFCLAARDAVVCLVARSEKALLAVEERILAKGGRAMAIQADVADEKACRHTGRFVAKSLGPGCHIQWTQGAGISGTGDRDLYQNRG